MNTQYRIPITWSDPNGVVENWIESSTGAIISLLSGSDNILTGLYFDRPDRVTYRIGARDSDDNVTRQTLLLQIGLPTIEIDDILP